MAGDEIHRPWRFRVLSATVDSLVRTKPRRLRDWRSTQARLQKAVADWEVELETAFAKTHSKQRLIREFRYAADSWKGERRLTTRLEFGSQGRNPRFVVTSLDRPAQALYDELYCLRGEAKNRIKEAQMDLFGTRASCHTFLANWLRLLLAALAYTLTQRLRTIALAGSGWLTLKPRLFASNCLRSAPQSSATAAVSVSC